MQLILGSLSPRRKEIMNFFTLPFSLAGSEFDEASVPFQGDPVEYALAIARGKAATLAKLHPEALILTADTVVHQEGKVYGKPENEEAGFRSLEELSGKWHEVITGVVLTKGKTRYEKAETTRVSIRQLSPAQIKQYQTSLDCSDKAGGYAIQNSGGLIVERIEGCFYNVMGLPLSSVKELLHLAGIDLWQHL